MEDVRIMRNHFTDGPPNLSEEQKERFKKALEGKLDSRTCRDCVSARGFVQAMEFVIEMMTDAAERMDVAGQRMESFIEVFKQLDEKAMMDRMNGVDDK